MLIALASWAGPTISLAKDCRVGLSTAVTSPRAKATTYTCQAVTTWVRVSAASTPAITASADWVTSSTPRLGQRSAIMPPNRPNSRVGRNCRAVVTPTAVALPVRLSTSQSWAMRCTQVPVLENSWPVANNRKFRVRKEPKTE